MHTISVSQHASNPLCKYRWTKYLTLAVLCCQKPSYDSEIFSPLSVNCTDNCDFKLQVCGLCFSHNERWHDVFPSSRCLSKTPLHYIAPKASGEPSWWIMIAFRTMGSASEILLDRVPERYRRQPSFCLIKKDFSCNIDITVDLTRGIDTGSITRIFFFLHPVHVSVREWKGREGLL